MILQKVSGTEGEQKSSSPNSMSPYWEQTFFPYIVRTKDRDMFCRNTKHIVLGTDRGMSPYCVLFSMWHSLSPPLLNISCDSVPQESTVLPLLFPIYCFIKTTLFWYFKYSITSIFFSLKQSFSIIQINIDFEFLIIIFSFFTFIYFTVIRT